MAKWTRISGPALQRSSHTLSLIGTKAYIFGGEIRPREPVDNALHVVDIKSGAYEAINAPNAPPARVGHVAGVIAGSIYVFGGRSVAEMGTALDESGAVHAFNTSSGKWTTLRPTSTHWPSARSYHAATTLGDRLIIHAGCGPVEVEGGVAGEKGRLWDVWAFDPNSRAWTRLADAPAPARGGTSITALNNKLYRFGGFSGVTELGGVVDSLSPGPGEEWRSAAFGQAEGQERTSTGELQKGQGCGPGPGPRSVAALHSIGERLVALYGEGRPSPTGGHDAAGKFWNDVWSYDLKEWAEVAAEGEGPSPRGWFASDADGRRVVLWGGLSDANERLSDGWVLEL